MQKFGGDNGQFATGRFREVGHAKCGRGGRTTLDGPVDAVSCTMIWIGVTPGCGPQMGVELMSLVRGWMDLQFMHTNCYVVPYLISQAV